MAFENTKQLYYHLQTQLNKLNIEDMEGFMILMKSKRFATNCIESKRLQIHAAASDYFENHDSFLNTDMPVSRRFGDFIKNLLLQTVEDSCSTTHDERQRDALDLITLISSWLEAYVKVDTVKSDSHKYSIIG